MKIFSGAVSSIILSARPVLMASLSVNDSFTSIPAPLALLPMRGLVLMHYGTIRTFKVFNTLKVYKHLISCNSSPDSYRDRVIRNKMKN